MRPKTVPGGAWSECAGLNLNYDFNYKSELPNYERSALNLYLIYIVGANEICMMFRWVNKRGSPRILIYNGDADFILSHMGNSAWINQGLGLNKTREWTKWIGSDGQVV